MVDVWWYCLSVSIALVDSTLKRPRLSKHPRGKKKNYHNELGSCQLLVFFHCFPLAWSLRFPGTRALKNKVRGRQLVALLARARCGWRNLNRRRLSELREEKHQKTGFMAAADCGAKHASGLGSIVRSVPKLSLPQVLIHLHSLARTLSLAQHGYDRCMVWWMFGSTPPHLSNWLTRQTW